MLSTTEISGLLNVTPQRVSNLSKSLDIPETWSSKKGRTRYFDRMAVRQFLERKGISFDINRVISISNNKGGVGKTAQAIAISNRLYQLGFTVNMIDIDPQANLSSHFISDEDEIMILADIIDRKCTLADAINEFREGFSILPSSLKNSTLEVKLASSTDNHMDILSPIFRNSIANFTIIDMSPSISKVNLYASLSSDLVIIPTTLIKDSVEGVVMTYENIKNAKKSWAKYGFDPQIKYIINSLDNRKSTQFKFVGHLDQLDIPSFETMIRTDNVVTQFQNQELQSLPVTSKFYQDIGNLVNEIIGLDQEAAVVV